MADLHADVPGLSRPVHTGLYIAGEWRPSSNGDTFDVHDPADAGVLAQVADATPDDTAAAMDAAYAALPEWAATPPRKRSEILRRAFEAMHERADDLALLMVRENGKALPDAKAELTYAAEFFRWFSEEAVRIDGDYRIAPAGGTRTVVTRQPVGVCLLITPWNFPAAMLTRKLGPSLAAGCTSLVKPAAETPLTALLLAELLAETGVPDGVVNLLPTSKASDVSKVAMSDSRLRKISFTGSTEVGRVLLKQAADQVLVSSMELGGNAPFIVCADADLDAAVEGAMVAKLRNGGEACTAANRFYVEAPVAEEFGRKLAEKMSGIKVGRGDEDGVALGPLVNEDTVQKVERIVRETVSAGRRPGARGGAARWSTRRPSRRWSGSSARPSRRARVGCSAASGPTAPAGSPRRPCCSTSPPGPRPPRRRSSARSRRSSRSARTTRCSATPTAP